MKKSLLTLSALLLTAGAARADITDNAFVSVLGGRSSRPGLSLGADPHAAVSDSYNMGARIGTALAPLPGFTVDADYFHNRADYSGGAEFPTSANTALFAEYRYQNAHDAKIGGVPNVGNTSNNLSVAVKFHM